MFAKSAECANGAAVPSVASVLHPPSLSCCMIRCSLSGSNLSPRLSPESMSSCPPPPYVSHLILHKLPWSKLSSFLQKLSELLSAPPHLSSSLSRGMMCKGGSTREGGRGRCTSVDGGTGGLGRGGIHHRNRLGTQPLPPPPSPPPPPPPSPCISPLPSAE